jgi:hypothetical protein
LPGPKHHVFLAPASSEHVNESVFAKPIVGIEIASIQGLIPIDKVSDVLTKQEKEDLAKVFPDGMLRMWGTRSMKEETYQLASEGDPVLFYHRGTYTFVGELAYKTKNEQLAK